MGAPCGAFLIFYEKEEIDTMIDFLVFMCMMGVIVYWLIKAFLGLTAIVLNVLEWIINKLRGWN